MYTITLNPAEMTKMLRTPISPLWTFEVDSEPRILMNNSEYLSHITKRYTRNSNAHIVLERTCVSTVQR